MHCQVIITCKLHTLLAVDHSFWESGASLHAGPHNTEVIATPCIGPLYLWTFCTLSSQE